MGEKGLAFFGTLGLLVFNIMVIIFGIMMFHTIPVIWAILFIVVFGCGALYFDWKVLKYFINKIREKRKEQL